MAYLMYRGIKVLGRARSFLSHAGMSVKSLIGTQINLLEKYWARRVLKNLGYLDFLEKRPPGSFSPETDDLWYLYRLVRSRKPKVILEFGSGCSTVLLAQALFDNAKESEIQKGFLYSMDVSENWGQVTKSTAVKYQGPHG